MNEKYITYSHALKFSFLGSSAKGHEVSASSGASLESDARGKAGNARTKEETQASSD